MRSLFLVLLSLFILAACQKRERKYSEDYVLIEFAAKLEEESARYHYEHKEYRKHK